MIVRGRLFGGLRRPASLPNDTTVVPTRRPSAELSGSSRAALIRARAGQPVSEGPRTEPPARCRSRRTPYRRSLCSRPTCSAPSRRAPFGRVEMRRSERSERPTSAQHYDQFERPAARWSASSRSRSRLPGPEWMSRGRRAVTLPNEMRRTAGMRGETSLTGVVGPGRLGAPSDGLVSSCRLVSCPR